MLSALLTVGAAAADETPGVGPSRETVVAGAKYDKSGFYRFLFGANYRDLWTTPVSIPVLDLRAFAGGLTPTRVVGHGQSQGLALRGADGRSYTFRPLLKDPSGLLPVELRESKAKDFVEDQMSSGIRPGTPWSGRCWTRSARAASIWRASPRTNGTPASGVGSTSCRPAAGTCSSSPWPGARGGPRFTCGPASASRHDVFDPAPAR